MTQELYLGIDGGGTKTAAVLLDGKGRELARAISGSSNVYSVGREVAQVSLTTAIQEVLSLARISAPDVTAIGLGMAGVFRPGDSEIIEDILAHIADFRRIVIGNDAETALVGGVGRRHGIVLIAGTGSIAYGVNRHGEARRADGWGYLVGDEGSAHWIGVQGFRSVARAHDGRGPATRLTAALVSYLGLSDIQMLVTLVYGKSFGVPELAGLAPLVSQAARQDDAIAQKILREAGLRLSRTLKAVVDGLDMRQEAFNLVLAGGVLRARDLVFQTVIANVGEIAPLAEVTEPQHDAAVGAALLAQLAGG
jgi:N-acetylglucosamine kinase-like BadF-type ATPase